VDPQYAAAYRDLYKGHWWWRVREEIVLAKIEAILGRAHDVRILDVGCGAGLFFDALERFGYVEGIESDAAIVEQAGRWQQRIVVAELDDSYTPDEPFDLILLLDVLEHVAQAAELLRHAARVLGRRGTILVTVPAFDWLWTAHDELNHHVKRYTAAEMRRVLTEGGLVPVETGYLFQSLIVPKLLVRAKEALTSRSAHVPGIPSQAVNAALQAWYRREYALFGGLPFGSSLMAIARHR